MYSQIISAWLRKPFPTEARRTINIQPCHCKMPLIVPFSYNRFNMKSKKRKRKKEHFVFKTHREVTYGIEIDISLVEGYDPLG